MAARFDLPLTPEEREELARRVSGLTRRPALAAVCLGELPPFVRQDCAACGLYLEQYALPALLRVAVPELLWSLCFVCLLYPWFAWVRRRIVKVLRL